MNLTEALNIPCRSPRRAFTRVLALAIGASLLASPTLAQTNGSEQSQLEPSRNGEALDGGADDLPARDDRASTGSALREGNRLFRAGELEAAVEAFRSHADGDEAGTIAYNLGTTLHHLGRLPEAVLWYRRAEEKLNRDPWLVENLDRARAELAAPRFEPPRIVALIERLPWLTPTLAALFAWIGLALALRKSRRRMASLGLGLAATIWLAAFAIGIFGPHAAVVVVDCDAAVPAGSEIWVRPDESGWRLTGGIDARCSAESLRLIEP